MNGTLEGKEMLADHHGEERVGREIVEFEDIAGDGGGDADLGYPKMRGGDG